MTVIEPRQDVIYERRGRINARELWEQMNTGIGEQRNRYGTRSIIALLLPRTTDRFPGSSLCDFSDRMFSARTY
jgi:hypothetical protein